MKRKILISIVLVFGVLLVTAGVLVTLQSTKPEEKPQQQEEQPKEPEIPVGEGGDMSPEEFYNWETNLYIRANEIMDETFNDKYTLDENGEFNITLETLQNKYKKDLSEFNNDTVECDLSNCKVKVTKNGTEYQKEIHLSCIYKG